MKYYRLKYPVILFLSVLIAAFARCEDPDNNWNGSYPFIQTSGVTKIDATGATFHGELISPGTEAVVDHGFVWSLQPEPNLADSRIVIVGPIPKGDFSTRVEEDLDAKFEYKVRAFARTATKVVYGNEVVFISNGSRTSVPLCPGC